MPAPHSTPSRTRRGRPPKYGQPGRVVAVTLPETVVTALGAIHADLGWAIVRLVEKSRRHPEPPPPAEARMVEVGSDQALIVVDPRVFHRLPGVQIVPLSPTQAFLAFQPGRGMTDLELAVQERLVRLRPGRQRLAFERLRRRLRAWRRDRSLAFDNRSIIIVARQPAGKPRPR